MVKRTSSPKSSELPVPAGAKGWEKIYLYHLVFHDRLKDAEDAKFWFCDSQHWPTVFKPEAETMTKVLDIYSFAQGPNWTMLAPAPEISPGARTGGYQVGSDEPVGASVSTADFAITVLAEIEHPRHIRRRFTVAN